MIKEQTKKSFTDKWNKNVDLAFSETLREGSDIQNWILRRNGWNTLKGLQEVLRDRSRILDGGCGNGRVTALLRQNSCPESIVMGIDLVSASVAETNLKEYQNVCFNTEDLTKNLTHLGKFDFIYSQEVLHHTGDSQKSFMNLCHILDKGGLLAIYVYRQKAPVREFVDDFVRGKISSMAYEDAMKACEQITELGRVLHKLECRVNIPAVDVLDIEEGEYDIQRFLYHFFAKCFWNDAFSFKDNSVINYDWYHPENCTRHTLAEVRGWFLEAGLEITHEFMDSYGITMHGRKNN